MHLLERVFVMEKAIRRDHPGREAEVIADLSKRAEAMGDDAWKAALILDLRHKNWVAGGRRGPDDD